MGTDRAGLLGSQVQVRAGRLRGIAITTPKRIASMPDLPAVAEALPGFEVVGWYGVIGPKGMPQPVVARLHQELVKILNQPDVNQREGERREDELGSVPGPSRVRP